MTFLGLVQSNLRQNRPEKNVTLLGSVQSDPKENLPEEKVISLCSKFFWTIGKTDSRRRSTLSVQ